MSFSYVGGVITQTGTDTSLAGLNGLTGVTTTTTVGGYTRYVTANTLRINGTLTIGGDAAPLEQLVIGVNSSHTATIINVAAGGSLTIGRKQTAYGLTDSASAQLLIFEPGENRGYVDSTGVPGSSTNLPFLKVQTGGSLNWVSGIVSCWGGILFESGSIVTIGFDGMGTKPILDYTRVRRSGEQASQLVYSITDISMYGLTVLGGRDETTANAWGVSWVQGATPAVFKNFDPRFFYAVFSGSAYTANGIYSIEDLGDFGQTPLFAAGKAAISPSQLTYRFYNLKNGSDFTVEPFSGRYAQVESYKRYQANARKADGSLVSGTAFYVVGAGGTETIVPSVTGETALMSFKLKTAILTNGTFTNSFFSKNNDTTDLIDVHPFAYGYNLSPKINLSFKGNGTLQISVTLFLDENVTLSAAQAAVKAALFTVDIATNTITVLGAATLDDLYSVMHWWKRQSVLAQMAYPDLTTEPMRASGTTAVTNMTVLGANQLTPGVNFKTLKSADGACGFIVINNVLNLKVGITTNNGSRIWVASAPTTLTIYVPPAQVGSYTIDIAGDRKISQRLTQDVTGGGYWELGFTGLATDANRTATNAVALAYTKLETTDEIYDYIHALNATDTYIYSPLAASFNVQRTQISIGAMTLKKTGPIGHAAGVISTNSSAISGADIVTTGLQAPANLPALTYPQVLTDSYGKTGWVSASGTAGMASLETVPGGAPAYVASNLASIKTFLPAGLLGEYTIIFASYGKARQTFTRSISSGGIYDLGTVVLPTDTFVSANAETASACTDLTSIQQLYDYYSYAQTTSGGIGLPNLMTKAFGSIAVLAPLHCATPPPAAGHMLIWHDTATSRIILHSTGISDDQTVVVNGEFTSDPGFVLGDAVRIRASNLDSEIVSVGVGGVTLYPSSVDRSSGANAGPTFTTILRYKYGESLSGVTMSGVAHSRVQVGNTMFYDFALVPGRTQFALDTNGQLQAIQSSISNGGGFGGATLAQIEASTVLAKKSDVQAVGVAVATIPTNPVLASDARLDKLDAAVSSRLAASSYAAPDNASLAAIKIKTDALPAQPAAVGSAMTLTAAYDAAKTAASQTSVTNLGAPAQATALAALVITNQAEHDATQAAIAALPVPAMPPSAATVATAVRAELTTELDRIDATISSRSTLTAAQVWSATTRTLTDSAGLTSGQAEQLRKVAQLHGVGAQLVVTETSRTAGDVSQTITTDDDGNTTVSAA